MRKMKKYIGGGIGLLCLCALAACKPETDMTKIDLSEIAVDTTGWQDYCLGYHSMKIPPDFTPAPASASIDWHEPEIIQDVVGSARDYIRAQDRFGEEVFSTRVNGWDFIVARERFNYGVSDDSLVFWGGRKVNDDVIVFTEDASISKVGDGSGPQYRAFYNSLNVFPETTDNRSDGFCFNGYVFSGYIPQNTYSYDAVFLGRSTRNIYKRSSFNLTLSMQKEPPEDERPLVSGPTFADFGIKAEGVELRKSGRTGGLIRLTAEEDGVSSRAFRAFIDGVQGDATESRIYINDFENKDRSPEESEAQILGFLQSIQKNER
ncbi:hypothetical protein [Celeribacter ethanolicus]|uniref:hypothetical protein n=1 Tax=Celeribacter ethanolicus TaxID=1758178 RepID=UPI000831B472|nr:hypothetical protein [Celeribacter ethanolicus]